MSYITDEILLHKKNPDKIPIDEIPPKSYLTSIYELLDEGYDESVVHDEIIGVISGVSSNEVFIETRNRIYDIIFWEKNQIDTYT